MFGRLFLKEWKEKRNIFLFSLLLLLVYAAVYLIYADEKGLIHIITISVLLILLPLTALLLGSSGFFSEFKDNAWAYLFSRPAKKGVIWVAKYLSLLSQLFLVFIAFIILVRILPGLDDIIQTDSLAGYSSGTYYLFTFFLLATFLLTVSFSLSFLSDRQFMIFLLAILISIGMFAALTGIQGILEKIDPFLGVSGFLVALWGLSFAGASVLAWSRVDFSQPSKKARAFIKYSVFFLVVSTVLTTAGAIGGFYWGQKKPHYLSRIKVGDGTAYFSTEKALFKLAAKPGKPQRLMKAPFMGNFSPGGGKIAFFTFASIKQGKTRTMSESLWVMEADGSERKRLIPDLAGLTNSAEDTLYSSLCLSPDGRRIAFVPGYPPTKPKVLWTVNSDGTGLKNYPLPFIEDEYIHLAGWAESGRSIILTAVPKKGKPESEKKIVKVLLETGESEVISGTLRKVYSEGFLSPQGDKIAFVVLDEADSNEVLLLYTLATREKKEIFRAKSIDAFLWNDGGSKIAFAADKKMLGVHSLAKGALESRRSIIIPDFFHPSLDWAKNGRRLVLADSEGSLYSLKIFGDGLKEEAGILIPNSVKLSTNASVTGLGDSVLVTNFRRGTVWSVDLNTLRWKRIY